jgi:hypothetical protein
MDTHIKNLVFAPIIFKQQNVTMTSIVSGNYKTNINIQDIYDILCQNKDLLDIWIQYSEDQRINEGWAIVKFFCWHQVFYYYRGNKMHKQYYLNKIKAVSNYVLKEIRTIYKGRFSL